MKKEMLLVFLAMILVVSLIGFGACAKPEEPAPPTPAPPTPTPAPPTPAPPTEKPFEWPRTLTIATCHIGGSVHMVACAWTGEFEQDTGVKTRAIAEGNVPLTGRWLRAGEVDMSFGVIGDLAVRIEGRYAEATRAGGPCQFRGVWPSVILAEGLSVRADSGLKTPYDLKGQRVAVPVTIPGVVEEMDAALAWGNLTREDVTWLEFSTYSGCQRAVLQGKADVAIGAPTSPTTQEVEAGPHGQAWLELDPMKDPEAAQRYLEVVPTLIFQPAYIGVESAMGVIMPTLGSLYVCLEDTDPELIYHLAKWLDENFDLYKDKFAACPTLSVDLFREMLDSNPIPIHEGTIRYLREIGMWDEIDDAQNQANIDLLNRYVEAYEEAIDMADDKAISVTPENEEWVILWENYKKQLGLPTVKSIMR